VFGTPTLAIEIVRSPRKITHRVTYSVSFALLAVGLVITVLLQFSTAQEPAGRLVAETSAAANLSPNAANPVASKSLMAAADLLPQTTQGFLRIVNFPLFVERWNQTQLGVLGKDDRLTGFWNEQRLEIQKRFSNAGWQLNFQVEDIYEIANGQAALAWIAKPQDLQKPFALALIIDIPGKLAESEKLLARIDKELKDRKAIFQGVAYKNFEIKQYTLPRKPGELVIRESLYAIVGDQLIAADELATLKAMIDASTGGSEKPLSEFPLFVSSRSKLSTKHPGVTDAIDVEYFIRPIGLAKLLRAISGKPVAAQTDALNVLEEQGFTKLAAASGIVHIASPEFDIFHNAFVLTELPLPRPVQVLDFPNIAGGTIPSWVGADASNFLSMAWNSTEAFWKVDTIVDAMADQKGVFESVIDGIKNDPVGPQIDIKTQVLPFLTSEIYSVGDTVDPITPESRRSMIAIRVNDPQGRLAAVLERAMKNEPDAKREDFNGFRIWKVTRSEDDEEMLESDDFGFGNKQAKPATQQQQDKPLLSNWAITIFNPTPQNPANGFLVFASHAEMIKEAIERNSQRESLILVEPDVALVLKAIEKLNNNKPLSVWQINRTDRAFKMQYELFRQDKLPQSKSMVATLFDRLLRPKDEVKPVNQKVKGDKLPPYSQISDFLMPGGSFIQTEEQGWSFSGFILSKPKG